MTRERKQGLGRECYYVAEESVWEIFDPSLVWKGTLGLRMQVPAGLPVSEAH